MNHNPQKRKARMAHSKKYYLSLELPTGWRWFFFDGIKHHFKKRITADKYVVVKIHGADVYQGSEDMLWMLNNGISA